MTPSIFASLVLFVSCASSALAAQALSFPKKNPLIAFTVPEDWKPQMKNWSLLALKKAVGERFEEIVWNAGKEPGVNKDEALGPTATFQEAQASDGPGTEKASVNLVTYVRAKGDKSLILLAQNPLRALEKHVDAMQAVVRSIEVR